MLLLLTTGLIAKGSNMAAKSSVGGDSSLIRSLGGAVEGVVTVVVVAVRCCCEGPLEVVTVFE